MEIQQKKILFGEQKFSKKSVAFIELSHPKALNALDTEMLAQIEKRLKDWEHDPEIALVVIHSENQKAFCAGGDVKSLTIETLEKGLHVAEKFFTQEYFTDCFVHNYRKPILAWLDGITMGGGVGLTQGASHRVATDRTLLSMPEVFIGLFPDVGGSGFLPQLKDGFGYFIGLSGARLSGLVGYEMGWQNFILNHGQKRKLIADILRLEWTDSVENNHKMLTGHLKHIMAAENSPLAYTPSDVQLLTHWQKIQSQFEKALAADNFNELVRLVNDTEGADGRARSILSQALFYELTLKSKNQSWEKVLSLEWVAAIEMSKRPSFPEGVRAVLIDKDQKPNWPSMTPDEARNEARQILSSPIDNLLVRRFEARK
jgi:enoyl-CoA hydratase/carnithine racemase